MEEPLYIGKTIREIIKEFKYEIVGVALISGSPVSMKQGYKKFLDLITFALVLGPIGCIKISLRLVYYRLREFLSYLGIENTQSIKYLSNAYNIPLFKFEKLQTSENLNTIKKLQPDIIINQANVILKKETIDIPTIGIINRHAGLLPKYRGLLAPFWALRNEENESGISIHFVDEKVDHGEIIVQKRVPIKRYDDFLRLLDRIFKETPSAMIQAITKLKNPDYKNELIPNSDEKATYYGRPTIMDAINFNLIMLRRYGFCARKKQNYDVS